VLGVHWFSDVAFGLLFGAVWGITVAVLSREIEVVDITALLRPRRARH
jgi:membrane-associated phospholipid phosphatase